MLKIERVAELLNQALEKRADSLARLDAAEKHWDRLELLRSAKIAWEAANHATAALILSQTGTEPERYGSRDTYGILSLLAQRDHRLKELENTYVGLSVDLFDMVICNDSVDPLEFTIEDIRKTADYIRECERLAGVGNGDA